ncbi:MAG: RecB-family nuclease [Acidilobaceae archaeon]
MAELVALLHNVSSVQRLVDAARLVYGLGLRVFVATKVYGAAAQSGIPEAMRLALRAGGSFLVLQDLPDALELLKPDSVLLVSHGHAREFIDPFNPPVYSGRVLVVFNGGDPDFSASELAYGTPVYVKKAGSRLGPVAEAALVLYCLLSRGDRGEPSIERTTRGDR